jgi:uncharacterized membrane protein YfcA
MHSFIGNECSTDSDCQLDGWEYCKIDGETQGYCEHKDLFPMKERELWGMIVVFGCLWLANMGGVGGGGMVVPIAMLFFKFDAKNAIALSNFSIFLSSAIRYLLNSPKPHPLKNGNGLLVDLNLALIMLPMIISGVSFGVIINIVMPDLIICAFFVIMLSYLGSGVVKKALKLRGIENEKLSKIES